MIFNHNSQPGIFTGFLIPLYFKAIKAPTPSAYPILLFTILHISALAPLIFLELTATKIPFFDSTKSINSFVEIKGYMSNPLTLTLFIIETKRYNLLH